VGQTASKATATLPRERGERSRKRFVIIDIKAGRWDVSSLKFGQSAKGQCCLSAYS
jgi:hypothetical protein